MEGGREGGKEEGGKEGGREGEQYGCNTNPSDRCDGVGVTS